MNFDIPQWFFTTMSIFLLLTVCIAEWFSAKGNLKIVYPLNMIKYLGFIVLETAIAINDPSQAAILLFNISNSWGLAMNIKGIARLYEEAGSKKRKLPTPPQFLKD